MLLRCRFTTGSASFGVGSNGSIGIKPTEGAIALLQNAATFFQKRLDIFDQLFFIELLFRCAVSFVETLYPTLAS